MPKYGKFIALPTRLASVEVDLVTGEETAIPADYYHCTIARQEGRL
jgi:hypothetical protein